MAQLFDCPHAEMKRILDVQKKAFIANGAPSTQERIRRIDVAIKLLLDNADALCAAVDEDFGGRPVKFTKFADVATVVDGLKNARAHVAKWSAPHRRGVEFPMNLAGASNAVEYVPKGVVGVISPWNYPVSLLFNPLAGIFAAGNSVMIKPSEFVPKTAELVQKLVAEAYDESVCRVVTGHADVAATFSSLPFDHLMFTGSAPASERENDERSSPTRPVGRRASARSSPEPRRRTSCPARWSWAASAPSSSARPRT